MDHGFSAAGEAASHEARPEDRTFKVTFGEKAAQTIWPAAACKARAWADLAKLLTTHEPGAKDGLCVVPGVLKGDRRQRDQVAQISILTLDLDKGGTLEEAIRPFQELGIAVAAASTFSHGITQTVVAESTWQRWAKQNPGGTEADYLRDQGYHPRVYEGAKRAGVQMIRTANAKGHIEDKPHLIIKHAPCSKVRVFVPLATPWTGDRYENGHVAADAWEKLYLAVGRHYGLQFDEACKDVARLFYLPRHNGKGPLPEKAILDGRCLTLEELEAAAAAGFNENRHEHRHRTRASGPRWVNDVHGQIIDPADWARGYAARFEVATALQARAPGLVRKFKDGTATIQCPFEDEHTTLGGEGTIAVNASAISKGKWSRRKRGFAVVCRHNSCQSEGRDRLDYVARWLENGDLTVPDLTDPEFLTEAPADGVEEEFWAASDAEDDFDLSHDGLALEMGHGWRNSARFVAKWGRWLFWNGSRWEADENLAHLTRTREFLRAKGNGLKEWAQRKAETAGGDAKLVEGCKKASAALRSAKTVAYVSGLARSNPELVATVGQWDSDYWVLNTPGGIVDLRTGALRPSDPSACCTKATAVAPAPVGTKAPIWQAFLERIFRHDPQLIAYMQRVLGYSLTGETAEQALFFALGQGGNGKGVCLNTITALLGDYAAVAPSDMLLTAKGDRHSTDMAGLRGARLVTAQELDRGKTWDEPKIKNLTGGDPITARLMRQDFFTYVPQFKLIVAGNNKPSFKGVDEAIRRRLHLVPFLQNIPAEERDPALPAKLRAEWPAILRWCIEGCLMWQREGLNPPESVRQASEQYLNAEDVLGQWIEDCCMASPRIEFCASATLYQSWVSWCAKTGQVAGTSKALSQKLSERGFEPHKKHGDRGFKGINVAETVHSDTKAETGAKASGGGYAFEFPDDLSDLM